MFACANIIHCQYHWQLYSPVKNEELLRQRISKIIIDSVNKQNMLHIFKPTTIVLTTNRSQTHINVGHTFSFWNIIQANMRNIGNCVPGPCIMRIVNYDPTCSSLIFIRVTKYIDVATMPAKHARITQRAIGCVISRKYGPPKKRTMGLTRLPFLFLASAAGVVSMMSATEDASRGQQQQHLYFSQNRWYVTMTVGKKTMIEM